jgi:hypothetical protein
MIEGTGSWPSARAAAHRKGTPRARRPGSAGRTVRVRDPFALMRFAVVRDGGPVGRTARFGLLEEYAEITEDISRTGFPACVVFGD